MNFADSLMQKVQEKTSVVVGIDPNFTLMPPEFWPKQSSRGEITSSLLRFTRSVVDASWDLVPAVKFQSAFFEQFGPAGIDALSESIAYAKQKQLLVILDAKRGDIGSTSLAYAKAYLAGEFQVSSQLTIKSGVEVDCMTVNPFLGRDSMLPFVEIANQYQKGLFVLVKTSNPDSKMFMDNPIEGITVSEKLAKMVDSFGKESIGSSGFSCIGAVVGATFPEEAKKLREHMPAAIFLAPGVGTQGGTIDTALACFSENRKGAIVPISRAITYPPMKEVDKKGYSTCVRENIKKFKGILDQERD